MIARIARIVALAIWAGGGCAQVFSIGVTGGVPTSPHSQSYPDVVMDTRPPQTGPNDLYAKPYTVGPSVELRLPWRLSFVAEGLYGRMRRDITTGLMAGHGQPVNFGYRADLAANLWDVPLMLRYRVREMKWTPFAGAGATLRHIGDFTGQGVQVDFYLQPQPATFEIAPARSFETAITVGAGARRRFGHFTFSPEVRFLHWTSATDVPARNQALLMLTISVGH